MTDASGLVYLRARYYVPGLGVFPSLDPVEEVSGHPYQYASADPANRTDPSGLIDWMSCTPTPNNPNLYSCYLPVPGWLEDSLQGVDLAYPELMDAILRINGVRRSGLSSNHINPQTPLNYQPRIGVGYYRHFAYDRDKSLLIPDSITASSFHLKNIIQRGQAGYLKSIIPQAPWTQVGGLTGYMEGQSKTASVLGFTSGGEETVYNFATFQRMDFSYTGGGITASIAASDSPYFGYIWGLTRGMGTPATHFASEYGGNSVFFAGEAGIGAKVPILGTPLSGSGGVSYFRSLSGSANGVLHYLSGGIGVSSPINVSLSILYSSAKPETLKSYTDPATCKVNSDALFSDIIHGSHTPIPALKIPVEFLGRTWAAAQAKQIADKYNASFASYCRC